MEGFNGEWEEVRKGMKGGGWNWVEAANEGKIKSNEEMVNEVRMKGE